MYQSSSKGGAGLPGAFGPIVTITSLLGAVFIGPEIWPVIEPTVWSSLTSQYDYQTAYWLAWVIRIGTFPACYQILRVGMMAALMAFTVFATKRLM